jgi:serine/threonine protein kinase
MEAIIAGDYKFEPEEYWANVSDTARDFVRACLTIDPERRPTAAECLDHKVGRARFPLCSPPLVPFPLLPFSPLLPFFLFRSSSVFPPPGSVRVR